MTVFILISWSLQFVLGTFYNKMDAEYNMEYYVGKGQYGEMEVLEIFVDTQTEIL